MQSAVKSKTFLSIIASFLIYLSFQLVGVIWCGSSFVGLSAVADTHAAGRYEVAPIPARLSAESLQNTNHIMPQRHEAYRDLLKQYQLAKLKHKLIQEQVAIALIKNRMESLKLSSVQHHNDVSTNDPIIEDKRCVTEGRYRLLSLDEQAGRWGATLGCGSTYFFMIERSSHLPDGSRVFKITSKAVFLLKNHSLSRVGFGGTSKMSVALSPHQNKPSLSLLDGQTPKQGGGITTTCLTALKCTREASKHSPDRDYLLSLPKGHFTIQLIGSAYPKTVNTYRRQHALGDKVRAFSIRTGSHSRWYMLVVGDYSSFNAAKHALALMPEALKVKGAWVRSIRSIQNDIVCKGA